MLTRAVVITPFVRFCVFLRGGLYFVSGSYSSSISVSTVQFDFDFGSILDSICIFNGDTRTLSVFSVISGHSLSGGVSVRVHST